MTSAIQQSPAGNERTRHYDHLDGLRAVAALYVVLHHSFLNIWPIDYQRMPHGVTRYIMGPLLYAHFAVDLFIVLSGFCLTLPIASRNGEFDTLEFFRRRARRILPPYYAALAVSTVLCLTIIGHKTGTHWDASVPITFAGFWHHLLLLNDFFNDSNVNHVFWSVAVECHIYLLFPLLVAAWSRWGVPSSTVAATAVAYGLYFAFKGHPAAGFTAQYIALFAFGGIAAWVVTGRKELERLQASRGWSVFAVVIYALVCGLCCLWNFGKAASQFALLDGIAGLGMAAMLVASMSPGENAWRRVFGWRPLVTCGTFAYSIYLIHAPLVQVFWQFVVRPRHLDAVDSFVLQAAVGVPIIIGACYLFFLVLRAAVSQEEIRLIVNKEFRV